MALTEDIINRRGNDLASLMKNSAALIKKTGIVLLLLFSITLSAKNLEVDVGVSTDIVWTDNVDIAVSQKVSDSYIAIGPFVRLNSQGRRVNASVDYSALGYMYNKHTGMNDMQHLLRGDLDVELIKDRFFTDVYISQESEVIDAEDAISFEGLFYEANSTNKYTGQINPRWIQPIAGDLGFTFFSSHGKIYYDRGREDIEEHNANVSLGTASRSTFLNWNINSSFGYVKTENQKASKQRQLDLSSSYPIFNKAVFFVTLGEKQERLSSSTDDSWDQGTIWDAKIAYSLSTRTKFELGGGEDLYGDTFLANISYETKKSALSLNYSEEQVNRVAEDIFEDTHGDSLPYELSRSDEVIYVQKKSYLAWKVQGVKNTIDMILKREERLYRNIGLKEILVGADIQWDYVLSSKSNLKTNLRWWRVGDDFKDRLDDMSVFSIKFTRNINEKSIWYTGVTVGVRDGTDAALEYKQIKVMAGVQLGL